MMSTRAKRLCVTMGLCCWMAFSSRAEPIGAAWIYQGQLKQGGTPVTGIADVRFILWDARIDGVLIDERIIEAVDITDGLFAASLDFGPDRFAGSAYWLEVAVRFPAGSGPFVTLTPRQPITPTPYALALPHLRTRDGNILGGSAQVYLDVLGATVSGGAANYVTDNHGTVGGGGDNTAGNQTGTTTDAPYATVGGGRLNVAAAANATIAGGTGNEAIGSNSTVGGGENNVAAGSASTVPGGFFNRAGGDYSFAAGTGATVREGDYGTFVWADTSGGQHTSTGANQFLVRASGGVGIGTNAPQGDLDVTASNDVGTWLNLRNVPSAQRYLFQVNGIAPLGGPGREGNLEIWGTGSTGNYNVFTATPEGNVGINTANPTNRLSVDGAANFTGSVGIGTDAPTANLDVVSADPLSTTFNFVNTSSAQRFLFQVNGSDPGGQDRVGNLEIVGFGDSIYHVLTATPDGKVGVNTYTPANALSVGGVADFNGSVGIGTATPTANLDVVSANPVATGINIKNTASSQRFLFQVNGSAPDGDNGQGNLEVWGTGAGGNHNVLTATTDGNVGIGTTNPSNALSVAGTADFSGKVGIGTTSPGYAVPSSKLEVSSGHIAVSNNYGVFSSNAAGNAIGAGFDTGHDDTLDLYAGGGRKVRITPAGDVGIGTDSPANALSVAGGADFSDMVRLGTTELGYTLTNTGLEVSQGNIMLGNAGGIVSVNGSDTGIGAGFRTGTSGDLYLYADGAVRVHVMPDGKVGIGSSPPSERLTVGGIVKSTTGGFAFPDGSVLASADGATIWSKSGTSAYYNGGSIGIGTSSPQDKLDLQNGNVTLDTGASGSSAIRFRYDGNLRWTWLYRSWATNEFGLYNESAGKWGVTFTTDTNRMGIGRTSPEHPLQVGTNENNGNGAYLTAGGMWTNASDRDSKEGFEPIDKRAILAGVTGLPVTTWHYKSEEDRTRHIGPTAQDFHAAFGLGDSDRHIGTIDADGVALAAIQGLCELIHEREEQLEDLGRRMTAQQMLINELLKRVEAIESKDVGNNYRR